MLTDIEIANKAEIVPIQEIASKLGIDCADYELYGKYKAKLALKLINEKVCPAGKEFNPTTKRCVKTCKSGQVRNTSFKCVREVGQRKTRKAKKSKSHEIINIFSRDA